MTIAEETGKKNDASFFIRRSRRRPNAYRQAAFIDAIENYLFYDNYSQFNILWINRVR